MIYAYLALQLGLFLIAAGGYFQVKKFLGLYSEISDQESLDAFRSLVRVNMYIALAYAALAFPSIGLSIYFGYAYGIFGLVLVIAVSVPQFLFGKYLRTLEERSRKLACNLTYQEQYFAVGETWFKKALPDF